MSCTVRYCATIACAAASHIRLRISPRIPAFRDAPCGGIIKPDVVLYEEGLDSYTINKSVDYISKADILIIGGTSLAVYPAAGLIDYYRGNKLVLVNKSPTPADRRADLVIHAPIGEVFSQL